MCKRLWNRYIYGKLIWTDVILLRDVVGARTDMHDVRRDGMPKEGKSVVNEERKETK